MESVQTTEILHIIKKRDWIENRLKFKDWDGKKNNWIEKLSKLEDIIYQLKKKTGIETRLNFLYLIIFHFILIICHFFSLSKKNKGTYDLKKKKKNLGH